MSMEIFDHAIMEVLKERVEHSHGRMIDASKLRQELRLDIEDYSADLKLRAMIRSYNDLLIEYIRRSQLKVFMHSRNFF